MRAIITKDAQNGKNYGDTRETVGTMHIVGKRKGYSGKLELAELVTARFYMGRSSQSSTVYCSLWVHGAGVHTAGHGQAGGYGYHKQSAALASAITSAGIELSGDQYERDTSRARNKKPAYIDGCGTESMRGALRAIAKAAGGKGELLVIEN